MGGFVMESSSRGEGRGEGQGGSSTAKGRQLPLDDTQIKVSRQRPYGWLDAENQSAPARGTAQGASVSQGADAVDACTLVPSSAARRRLGLDRPPNRAVAALLRLLALAAGAGAVGKAELAPVCSSSSSNRGSE